MKFTLDAGGAQAAGQGIGNLFKAYALGPQMRQQAEQDTAAKLAQIYSNNMQGNKYGAEAEGLGMTNRARTAPVDPTLSRYMQDAYKLFQATGDTNMERFANAGTALQTQGIRDQAVANVDNLDAMNRLNTLAKPGDTYMPFDSVGTSGYSVNKATGAQLEANPVVAKIFQQVEGALANQRNAAAGASGAAGALSNARRERVASGLDKPVTIVDDETGLASVTALPTRGDPRTIGVAAPKGTGADATNAKARNAVVAAVEREMGTTATDAEIQAEVDRRMARRGTGNKNPAPAKTGETMPQETKTIGTKTYVKVNGQWYEK
ncbi:hypothetical protein [Limnohabitans sp.]|uniref:hypothetical protein n=1 Tax=Limnohabitans sp. TaxID=1907725 RepID=UPI0025C32CF2|nr:hypothetical protein [Limnohabitans sp.]